MISLFGEQKNKEKLVKNLAKALVLKIQKVQTMAHEDPKNGTVIRSPCFIRSLNGTQNLRILLENKKHSKIFETLGSENSEEKNNGVFWYSYFQKSECFGIFFIIPKTFCFVFCSHFWEY